MESCRHKNTDNYCAVTFIIQEHFVNSWSSVHTVRMYKRMPKKYAELVSKILD